MSVFENNELPERADPRSPLSIDTLQNDIVFDLLATTAGFLLAVTALLWLVDTQQ